MTWVCLQSLLAYAVMHVLMVQQPACDQKRVDWCARRCDCTMTPLPGCRTTYPFGACNQTEGTLPFALDSWSQFVPSNLTGGNSSLALNEKLVLTLRPAPCTGPLCRHSLYSIIIYADMLCFKLDMQGVNNNMSRSPRHSGQWPFQLI